MILQIGNMSLENYQLEKQFTYSLQTDKEISYDLLQLDLIGANEFNIVDDKSIIKASNNLNATVYLDSGEILTTGILNSRSFNYSSGITQVEIYPDILRNLQKKPSFFQENKGLTPTKILYMLLQENGLESILDEFSFQKLDNLFELYGVTAGLKLNTTDDKTKTIIDVINEMGKNFGISIYFLKSKILFESDLYSDKIPIVIRDQYISDYNYTQVIEKVINSYSVKVFNFSVTSKDLTDIGNSSIENYGEFSFDVAPSLWLLDDGNNSIDTVYAVFITDALNAKIEKNKVPRVEIKMTVTHEIIDELNLKDLFIFENVTYIIKSIESTDQNAVIIGVMA